MFLFKNTDISWCTVVCICRDGPKKKTVATLKVRKLYAQNFDVRLVKASMSTVRHYRVLP